MLYSKSVMKVSLFVFNINVHLYLIKCYVGKIKQKGFLYSKNSRVRKSLFKMLNVKAHLYITSVFEWPRAVWLVVQCSRLIIFDASARKVLLLLPNSRNILKSKIAEFNIRNCFCKISSKRLVEVRSLGAIQVCNFEYVRKYKIGGVLKRKCDHALIVIACQSDRS